MNKNKLLTVLICGVSAVLILTGIAISYQATRIGRYVNGAEVEGTVYDYEVRYSRGSGAYHCFLFCRYEDEAGRIYKTEFQYNFGYASKDDAENYGETLLNKPIKLYFNGRGCISETEAQRYIPFVTVSVVLCVAGAAVACVPMIIKAVKKKRAKLPKPNEEDYLI